MKYIGSELELFADAVRWKRYVRDRISPYVRGRVLEVGAGIGAFTEHLAPLAPEQWSCLEPDLDLLAEIDQRRTKGRIPHTVRSVPGTVADIPIEVQFDSILYLDVLEHIEDHHAEAARAADLLAPGGHLIVLGPAFQFVYSPFDAAVGHCRRYTRASLASIRPTGLVCTAEFYMDAPGLVLSLANRLLLRNSTPRKAQIAFWDRTIVPVGRILDHLFGHYFGRSVVAIWQKPPERTAPTHL